MNYDPRIPPNYEEGKVQSGYVKINCSLNACKLLEQSNCDTICITTYHQTDCTVENMNVLQIYLKQSLHTSISLIHFRIKKLSLMSVLQRISEFFTSINSVELTSTHICSYKYFRWCLI